MSPTPSRETMTDRRVPQIDGLRALGMFMVYLFHTWQFGGSPMWTARVLGRQTNLFGFLHYFSTGVDLFMVISGFCLFWPLCKSAEAFSTWNWRVYYRRRIRRILPPYYAAIGYVVLLPMLLVAIFHRLGLSANWQPIPSAWQLFTHFLLIHSLFPSTWDGITGSFWSLGLEAQFYVVFPLAILAFRRSGPNAIWLLILGSILFRTVTGMLGLSPDMQLILTTSFLGRWMEFGFGMLTALGVSRYWRLARVNSAAVGTVQIGVALLVYILAVEVPFLSYVPAYEVLLSISFALLIFALCTSSTPIGKLFRNPVVDWLGSISYSLYLLHQPTAWYLSEFFKKELHLTGAADFYLLATAGFAIVVGVSYPFYLIFERPGLTMNRSKEKAGTAPTPFPARRIEEPSLRPAFANSTSYRRSL